MACRSLSVMCELDSVTSSAIGPVAALIRLWPVFR